MLVFLVVLLALLAAGSYRLEQIAGRESGGQALSDLRLAQTIRPWSPRLHRKIAALYLRQRRPDLALDELGHSVTTAAAHPLQIESLIELHRYADAAKLAAAHSDPAGLKARAFTAYASGNPALASHLLTQINSKDYQDQRLAAWLTLPDTPHAISFLSPSDSASKKYLASLFPSDPNRLLGSAQLLQSQLLFSPAQKFAEKLTTETPGLPAAWILLAQLQLDQHSSKNALSSLRQAELLDPIDKQIFSLEAQAYRSLGDQKSAAAADAKSKTLR